MKTIPGDQKIAVGYFFVKQNSAADESVTCIAVKEDRHHNIMGSEQLHEFVRSDGYCEITLKSDAEPAIVAFRTRVAEVC